MSYSQKWQDVKAARKARRAADPRVQARARRHAEKTTAKPRGEDAA